MFTCARWVCAGRRCGATRAPVTESGRSARLPEDEDWDGSRATATLRMQLAQAISIQGIRNSADSAATPGVATDAQCADERRACLCPWGQPSPFRRYDLTHRKCRQYADFEASKVIRAYNLTVYIKLHILQYFIAIQQQGHINKLHSSAIITVIN